MSRWVWGRFRSPAGPGQALLRELRGGGGISLSGVSVKCVKAKWVFWMFNLVTWITQVTHCNPSPSVFIWSRSSCVNNWKFLTTWPNLFKFVINNYVAAALFQNCRFYDPRGKSKGWGLNLNIVSHERHNIFENYLYLCTHERKTECFVDQDAFYKSCKFRDPGRGVLTPGT